MTDLLAHFSFLRLRESLDHPAYDCPREELIECLRALRDEHGFDLLSDVTAIDHYEASPRFEVVYHLYSTGKHQWVRLCTPCVDDNEPRCPSIVALWPGANWHERETYDMFGITFEGHPDLRRILMWDGYPYFPLRKEFPLAGHEVELPSPEIAARTNAKVLPAPMMGGPFHSGQRGSMKHREPRADDESWTERREKDPAQANREHPREF
ncbi:MAG: NADH-quinone oxidoreductase subunit C [Opitutales bacterium]